ncbi:MAG: alpha/beta hydrolase fold domain-containing protein [Bacilli bacterium]|nr:alpha/beta hydrolase fold domain-containing protein [Bacilli bacterium]
MKYNIDKKFGMWRYMKSPMNRFVFGFANFLLSIMPKRLKSKDLIITKLRLKNCNIYFITPKKESNNTLMYFHGGAFCFKGGPNHFKNIKEYARKTSVTIVYADYHMAYQSDEEICVKECFEAYNYILLYSQVLGINTDNIGFAGDSAGGYISLSVINECFKRKIKLPKYQMLIYPVVSKNKEFKSIKEFTDTPMWNSKLNKRMWEIYANGKFTFDPLIDDISFMPPTYIEVCEFDCLHDEGVELSKRLCSLNIDNTLNETYKTMHGYDVCFKHPIVVKSFEERINFIKRFHK